MEYFTEDGNPYYHHIPSKTTQWEHPMEEYYRGVVFMKKDGGDILLRKSLESPPTPDEAREMARYFGIKPREEWKLMEVAKSAVNAPLPPEWDEFEDDDNEVHFYNKILKKTSNNHPLDGYFLELIRKVREETLEFAPKKYGLKNLEELNRPGIPEPWIEFRSGKTGEPYYYNFLVNETAYAHPREIIKQAIRIESTVVIQACFRGWKVRAENRMLVEDLAAMQIQAMFRGHQARKEVDKVKYSGSEGQIRFIQRSYRAHLSKRDVFAQMEVDAARKLQAAWRGVVARGKVEKKREVSFDLPDDLLGEEEEGPGVSPFARRLEELETFTRLAVAAEPDLEYMTWEEFDRRLFEEDSRLSQQTSAASAASGDEKGAGAGKEKKTKALGKVKRKGRKKRDKAK